MDQSANEENEVEVQPVDLPSTTNQQYELQTTSVEIVDTVPASSGLSLTYSENKPLNEQTVMSPQTVTTQAGVFSQEEITVAQSLVDHNNMNRNQYAVQTQKPNAAQVEFLKYSVYAFYCVLWQTINRKREAN